MTAAADSTWTGGAGANWNDGGNWNTLPNAGDTLIFTGVANPSTNNDFTAGTSFGGITFDNQATAGEFTLSDNDIILGGNLLTLGSTGAPTHVISLNLSLDGDRTVTTALDNNLTLSGIIGEDASARSLTKLGEGILRLGNANTYSGGTTVTAGTLRVENVDGLGTGGVTLNGGRLVFVGNDNTSFNNADVNVTADSTLVSDRFDDGAGANHTLGNLTIGSQTLTVDSSGGNSTSGNALVIVGGTTTLNGNASFQVDNTAGAGNAGFQTTGITGTGGFTKTGNGLMVMAGGTYNYDGNAVLDNGTLRVTGANNLQNTTFVNGGTLELRNLNGARQTDLVISGGSLDLRNNSSTTFTTKTLTVTAGNVATIESRDINGTIDGLEHTLSSDGIILQAGSTLRFTNFEDFDLKVDAPGGGVPSILLEGDATLDVRSTSLVTIVGPIEDGGNGYGLTISSNLLTNTLVLEAPSTYGGNTQFRSSGTNTSHVRLGVDNALPHGAGKGDIDMALAGGEARIDLNGFNQTVNGLFDAGLGVIDNSHATNPSILTVGDNDGGGTFSGQLIDSGAGGFSLVKTGAGAWVFNGTGDYTGTTTVSAGTLLVNGDLSAATGDLTVAAGATLGGSGTIGGASTILGIHAPGTSPGLQTFTSDLSYGADAQVFWELADNTISGRGTVFDGIDVGGSLAFDGFTTLNLVFDSAGSVVDWSDTLFWGADQSWLIWGVSSPASSFGNLSLASTNWLDGSSNNFDSLGTFSLREDTGGVFLDFTTAIPEPSRAVLILFGIFSITLRRRRTTR